MPTLSAHRAADYLSLSPQTLANWRVKGYGPPFRKHGRRVAYDEEDLRAWSDARKKSNTQQNSIDVITMSR